MTSGEDPNLDLKVKTAMIRFYDALEKALKRYRPDVYIPCMAKELREAGTDAKRYRYTPPHAVLHSIEANCAFHRSGYDEPVNQQAIARIMNTYQGHIDPLQMATSGEKTERFFLMMWREQMEVQQEGSWAYLARTWELFVENPKMASISGLFRERNGLGFTEWIQLCFLTWAAAKQSLEHAFTKDAVMTYPKLPLDEPAVDAFLGLSCLAPKDIGDRFRKVRCEFSPKFHSLIRSVFLQYPIVKFDNGKMTSPQSDLLLLHSGRGLYRLARDIDGFDRAFSDGFEQYIAALLSQIEDRCHLLSGKDLQVHSRDKSCDFLLEMRDVILLVECKACMLTANLLTDKAIENDNSTGKVAKGLEQLSATARDIADGAYAQFGIDTTKEVLGIVVTFGDIPMANSDWYFLTFFCQRVGAGTTDSLWPSGRMTKRPIVLSVDLLEDLVRVLNTRRTSMLDLCRGKQEQPYFIVGDWDGYLRKVLAEFGPEIAGIALVKNNVNRLLGSLGVSQE